MNEQIMRGIKMYVNAYKSRATDEERVRISKEVGLYLSHVTANDEDFMFYASEFVCRTHEITLVERIKRSLDDWI